MERPVEQRHRDIDHRKAQRSALHRIAYPGFDPGDILPRDRTAGDLVLEHEPFAQRQRADLDHAIAVLAVPAGLLLVPSARAGALADRLAIGDPRGVGIDRNAIAALQPADHHGQVIVVDPAQDCFMTGVVLAPFERRVFLAQPVQRGRELDVVLAVAGGDGDRGVARRIGGGRRAGQCRALAAEHHAGPRPVDLGHRNHVAGPRGVLLGGLFALDEKQRSGPLGSVADHQFVALGQVLTEHPAQRKPAHGPAIGDLEYVQRPAFAQPHPLGRSLGGRGFVAQQLEQAVHPAIAQRRTEHHRHDLVPGGIGGKVGHHQRLVGGFVHQQGFEQIVIEIGQRFEQVGAIGLFDFEQFARNLDPFALLAGAVAIGAFQR